MEFNFKTKEELYEYLSGNDLSGLDSEYSHRSRVLVEKFNAKGMDLNRWWVMTAHDWKCPCCLRSKPDIVRLNRHNYLTAHLHEHHDHMSDYVGRKFTEISESLEIVVADTLAQRFVQRTAFALTAYDHTIICSDCNAADADAKKELNLPKEFSFSPNEIGSFIESNANKKHKINKNLAIETWLQCEGMFNARQRLVAEIAYLAATNSHWYQPSRYTSRYIESIAKSKMEYLGISDFGIYPPEQALYSTNKFSGTLDSWRINRTHKKPFPPTEGQIAHLAAVNGYSWNKADSTWCCAGCRRSKYQCVRKSNKDEWSFNYDSSKLMLDNKLNPIRYSVCSDCADTMKHLGKEAKNQAGIEYVMGSSLLTLDELQSIILVRPHSKHMINNVSADDLVSVMVSRASKT